MKQKKTQRGIRQIDSLSPRLFTAVLESVFRQLNWKKEECQLTDTT